MAESLVQQASFGLNNSPDERISIWNHLIFFFKQNTIQLSQPKDWFFCASKHLSLSSEKKRNLKFLAPSK